MKFNRCTLGLMAAGLVSLSSAARADESMSPVQTALSQTTLSGYVDTAMQWNPGTDYRPGSFDYPGNVPKYTFATDDGFQLNAVDIALDRSEDTSQWAAGYRVEMMYGADAVGVPFGVAQPTLNATPSATIRQAFIRLHTPIFGNGIDWQVGVFDSIIGYESSSGPLNPNYTRSYGYSIEPTTLTGFLGTYKVNDNMSMSAGVADRAGALGNAHTLGPVTPSFTPSAAFESQKTYMGNLVLTAPDSFGFLKGATLSGGAVHGVNSNSGLNSGATTSIYAGATLPTPISILKVGVSFDYLLESGRLLLLPPPPPPASLFSVTGNDDIWVVGAYAAIQATDKLSFNLRGEYVSDDSNPADVENLYAYLPNTQANSAEEVTATVQYNLWANVLTRGEFRWDHVEHGEAFGANSTGAQFRSNDFLLALNIAYQF
ncbi:MAG TPA: outer membrane beta-barrel protein [Candidatus Sulfotelmatobacter sp.]|nr:outer membrane beta-barrel protein [Candidatus Sulfotelmatobacter sp.]